uniref:Uncharacterized protein n=1 Tax=Halimeda minima TaxID=170427 RepID=A0A386AZ04_9CHLO|nr:hypothetical protein [Halimeda minima]
MASNQLTISVEKLEKFECVKQKLEAISFNIVKVHQMIPKLEARFSNEYLLNLKQNMQYLKKVVNIMATILEKLKSSEEPKLASEDVFAFYSLTALKLKKWEPLVRFPILGNSQRLPSGA